MCLSICLSQLPSMPSHASVPFCALSESVHTEVSRIMHIWDCDVLEGISSEFCHEEVGSDSIAVASGSMASFRGDDQSFPIVRAGERLSGIGADFEVGFIHTEVANLGTPLIFLVKLVEMEKTYSCPTARLPYDHDTVCSQDIAWGANDLFSGCLLSVWNMNFGNTCAPRQLAQTTATHSPVDVCAGQKVQTRCDSCCKI